MKDSQPKKGLTMTRNIQSMSLPMAKALIKGAQAEAKKLGYNIVTSVYDNHGNIKAFERMDETSFGSIQVSQLKAKTAANFPVSTSDLAIRSAAMDANPYSSIPDMLLLGGGLPIFTPEKVHIGSIGISGATPEVDTACAEKGIEQLYDELGWLK